jgi:hypothetical protein
MKSERPAGVLIAAAEVHLEVTHHNTVIHAADDDRCEAVCQPGQQLLPTFSMWETLEPKWTGRCPRCLDLAPAQGRSARSARLATQPDVIWKWTDALNKMTVTVNGIAFRLPQSSHFRTRFLPWDQIDRFASRRFMWQGWSRRWCIELIPSRGRSWRRRAIPSISALFESEGEATHWASLLNKGLSLADGAISDPSG